MSCSFLLIPTKFPTLNSYSKHINSTALLGFSSFSCLRNRRRSNSIATSFSRGRSLGCKCQLADIAPVTSAAYGVILLGVSKSGSKGSLFGGLTGAALMGTAYFLMQAPETKAIGDSLGFVSAFLFSSVFGIRLAATQKLIPSGLLLGLSICALAVFIAAYLQDSLITDLV
ncbi:protein FATTY ACID EXPORT 4, chloroplastic-like isoform X2 [Populus nigra]|uniref:protein FATTY ACID EXPORT 4, chloroplastic-like isoform X2 n=1 Tax=Populus nigra TaxID=3691 RepID=UPI002B269FC0|nr:protein FATTY ACID EXPORT 4, chloroplastic-like isoform X2 [Populus nigra]